MYRRVPIQFIKVIYTKPVSNFVLLLLLLLGYLGIIINYLCKNGFCMIPVLHDLDQWFSVCVFNNINRKINRN